MLGVSSLARVLSYDKHRPYDRVLYSDMDVKIEYAKNSVLRKSIRLARITEEIGKLRERRTRTKTWRTQPKTSLVICVLSSLRTLFEVSCSSAKACTILLQKY